MSVLCSRETAGIQKLQWLYRVFCFSAVSKGRLGTSVLFWSVNHWLESLETIHVVNEACRSERQPREREKICRKSHPPLTPVIIHFFAEEEQFHCVDPGRK